MERRNYTRRPLHLRAALIRPGTGVVEGTISDFRPGGLFLELNVADRAASEPLAQVETDEPVQVQFSVDLDGATEEFKIRARVSGAFKGGIG